MANLDVIKDIPGYKVILKAVLKAQIQQMLEQLAAHTDEESVILTASVADGTLSHMGSDSGKGFLSDHEDFKSQFLGFCLKSYHKKQKEEEERKRQQQMLESMHPMPIPAQLGYGPAPRRNPRAPYTRQVLPQGRGSLSGMGMRSPGARHEPYPNVRPQRNLTGSMPTTPVKLEPGDTSNDSISESDNVNQSPSHIALSKDDDKSNSSSSTIPNEASESNAGAQETNSEHCDLDPDVNVKVEAISEADMELEITGVEPGRPMTSQDWDPNVSMEMNFDLSAGATGTAADMQQNSSTTDSVLHEDINDTVRDKYSEDGDLLEIHYNDATQRVIRRSVTLFQEFLGQNVDLMCLNKVQLNEKLRMFYASIKQLNGKELKKKSLDSIRYGICRYLKEKCNIDAKHDPAFITSVKMYKAKCKDLQTKGFHTVEHVPPLTEDDLRILSNPDCPAFDTNTADGLQRKVWFDLCFHLCRKGTNLREMTKDSFEVKVDNSGREYIQEAAEEIDESQSYSSVSVTEKLQRKAKLYAREGDAMCPVALFKKYMGKLNPSTPVLWQRPNDTRVQNVWYSSTPIGKNTLTKFMSEISKLGRLSKIYTNQSLHATSIETYNRIQEESYQVILVVKEENC